MHSPRRLRTAALSAFAAFATVVTMASPAEAQDTLSLQAFGDVNAADTDLPGDHPAFALGGLDLFFTSSPSESLEMLAETVLEILDEGAVFDLERLYVQYNVVPALKLRGGRFHLPLGYYQTAYHHATLFQLTTQRPIQWRFEDEGGPLPSHVVGIEALGSVPLSEALALSYSLFVGNGRGHNSDEITNIADSNRGKMVGGRAALVLAELELGVSGSFDTIPGGQTDGAGVVVVPEDLYELIAAAHAAYMAYPFEVIAEGFVVRHQGLDSDETYLYTSAYFQGGYELGRLTPYARVDWLERDVDDPFFNASGTPTKLLELSAGVRVRLHEKFVVKGEASRELEGEINRVAAQAAFSF